MSKKRNVENKSGLMFKVILVSLGILFTLFCVFGRFIPNIENIYKHLDIYNYSVANGANKWIISISYIINVMTITFLLRLLFCYVAKLISKGKVLFTLLSSFLKYIAFLVILFCILASFGVDTTSILAGIGILSLVVGLGAQPLIEDIIAGLFIAFESVFDVGDVIVVDNFRGVVKEIGIRTTKIEDDGGDVKTINNSDIRTLINMSSQLSIAVSDVAIEYSESIERVEKVIEENLDRMKKEIKCIKEGPFYKGVQQLGASGVVLRFVAKCKEGDVFQTQREMNRLLKIIFDENNISIPFNQIVVHNIDKGSKE